MRSAVAESCPDVVVSFTPEANVRTILATRGLRMPVIVSERTDPALYDIGWKWNTLRRVAYPFADRLVCQTEATLTRFHKMTKIKGSIIPNLIAVPPVQTLRCGCKRTEPREHVLVAMGRLVPQKGFDILLKAFSQIMRRHSSWSLKILGSGPLRGDLRKLAEGLNMTEKVHFSGVLAEPFADLRQADLFVLSSRFEGFPNALCEAMACGLPVVSFDCPEGPSDIVRDGVDGLLVPAEDATALATALDDLMSDGAKRERFGARAGEILERFAPARVLSLWDKVFADLIPGSGKMRCESH